MPKKNYDSDEHEEFPEYDEDYSDTEVSSCHDDDESEYMYALTRDPIVYDERNRPPNEYQNLKLGQTVIKVSTLGKVQTDPHTFLSTDGIVHTGTPFRTITVKWDEYDFRTFFVHELVWWAFKGFPPEGWEVRHKPEYTAFHRKTYSNALHHLTMVPTTVTRLYEIQKAT